MKGFDHDSIANYLAQILNEGLDRGLLVIGRVANFIEEQTDPILPLRCLNLSEESVCDHVLQLTRIEVRSVYPSDIYGRNPSQDYHLAMMVD